MVLAVHLGEITPDTEGEMEEGLHHFRGILSYKFMVEGHGALALLKWAQGQREEAAAHLQTAFTIAQERGYHHFFILSRTDLLKLSILALELELPGLPLECACRFLTVNLSDLAGPELLRLSRHAKPGVAEKARELHRLVHRAVLPRFRFQTLGSFRVCRGEVLLTDHDWEGHQPQILLKALITHGPSRVPLDVLLEALWPEASPETAMRNFTVNLHRLRRALEPDLDKTFGSSYVHLKAKLVSLDEELCEMDVQEFSSLCRAGEKKEEEGNIAQALSLYQEGVKIYQGDFLPEEPYLPWAESKRQALRRRYIEVLSRMAGLHERGEAVTKAMTCYRQLLNADPLWEPAYQKLMLFYAHRGQRTAALKVYEDCRQALRQGLDSEPDPATTAIYRKILSLPSIM